MKLCDCEVCKQFRPELLVELYQECDSTNQVNRLWQIAMTAPLIKLETRNPIKGQ